MIPGLWALAFAVIQLGAGGTAARAQDQNWDNRFGSVLSGGLSGFGTLVRVTRGFGTNTFVAGSFTSAAGVSANGVARWDGSHWNALGTGTTNGVDAQAFSLAVSANGDVYVGGVFTHAGGLPANGIARWDGTNWHALGTGLDSGGMVLALAVGPNGEVYAGGRFTSIGGVAVRDVAQWNGTNWSDMAGGFDTGSGGVSVLSLLRLGTNVFAGGNFGRLFATANPVPGIAVWNGSAWSAVGPTQGAPNPLAVQSLATDGTNLFAAGSFTELGGVMATNLARWDGQNWTALGPAVPSSAQFLSVAVYQNEVFVGGNFTAFGSQPLAGLARRINNQWWPVGRGLSGPFPIVYSLDTGGAGLFVGGDFTQAGTNTAKALALWNLTNEVPVIQISNPTNGTAFFGYDPILISAVAGSANGAIAGVEFFVDGNSLGTATNPPYGVAWPPTTPGSHVLSARATDVNGKSWSAASTVTVTLPLNGPIITQSPTSQTVSNGANIVITSQATGNGVLSYQWYNDGVAVVGATSSSLSITNAQLANAGVYRVQVGDIVGTNFSGSAPISVLQPVAPLWSKSIGRTIYNSPVIGQGGNVSMGTDDGYLYTYGTSGAFQWWYQTTNYLRTAPTIGTNNAIYFGSSDQNIYAVNPDGTTRWVYNAGGQVGLGVAVGVDGTIYVGTSNKKLLALHPTGKLAWSFTAPGAIYCAPAVATNGVIYFSCADGNVYALNPNGTKLWSYSAGVAGVGTLADNSPIIDADGTIYVTAVNTNLYALRTNGTLKWKFTGAGQFHCAPVIGADGSIYVGNDGSFSDAAGTRGRFYALTPGGTEKWEFVPLGKVRSSAAVAADGTIYFGADDGKFYALNPDGTERWEYQTQGIIESSPAIRFDGAVYFCGGSGASLYLLPGSSPLAVSPWPMLGHDLAHTGNAATPHTPDVWFYPFDNNQFDAEVDAVAALGNDIYVGGAFQHAGGISANHVAHWDGTNWSPLGVGVSGPVNAIAVSGSNVYVGGNFTSAGGQPASYVAVWDGSQWHPLGTGASDAVYSLAATTNFLYAGGRFTGSSGNSANVGRWNGHTWTLLAGLPNGAVNCLAAVGGDLYAGVSGSFQHWDGTQWVPFGQAGDIRAIALAGNAAYVGGEITQIGGVNASGIAEWNLGQWLSLGAGVGDPGFPYVYAITIDGPNVYAGGAFSTAGGTPANRIARWDGFQWHGLGSGVSGQTPTSVPVIRSLAVVNGLVYAGGSFLSAGGDATLRYFGVWDGIKWSSVGQPVRYVNGDFRLVLNDWLGRTYGVEASPDLIHWTRVTTFTNLGGYSEFIDHAGTNGQRFFRTVVP